MRLVLTALLLTAFMAGAAHAAEKAEPVPRFVSLRADVVNLRTGPGSRYPIEWVYRRKGYPLEIVAQYDEWRQVRDWQGTEGWVHQRMVTGTRNVIIQGKQRILRSAANMNSPPVAKVDPGVIAHLLECRERWCRIEVRDGREDMSGWLTRSEMWGVFPEEEVRPP